MVNIAIIGCGYWGPNFIRLAHNHNELNLISICDKNLDALSKMKETYPSIISSTDVNEIAKNPEIDAVIVSTPVDTHFEICKILLENNKHVLCEKPLTKKHSEATDLYDLASKKGKLLMTGHTFLYNSSVNFLKKHINNSDFGNSLYFNFVRTGLGPIRQDVNAMWDLAPHDISMLLYFINKPPVSVTAFGGNYVQNGLEDVVFIVIQFDNNILAKIHLSWLDPIKTRRLTVVGEKQMVTFDDVELNEKVKIYDKGVSYLDEGGDYGEFQLAIRDGGINIPNIKNKEPLKEELNNFVDCIIQNKTPVSSENLSCEVIKILEAAQESLDNNNKKVKL